MRPDGQLFAFSTSDGGGNVNSGGVGNLLYIDTGTAATTNVGDDGLNTFWIDNGGNVSATGNAGYLYEAMMFLSYSGDSQLYAIGNRGGDTRGQTYTTNVLYRFNAQSGAVNGFGPNRSSNPETRHTGSGTEQRDIGQVVDATTGNPLAGTVTGMVRIEGTTFIVDTLGNLYTLDLGTAAATFRAHLPTKSGSALLSNNLQGLTKVPGEVENRMYANVLYTIDGDGTLYAFYGRDEASTPAVEQPGDPAPIFLNGDSTIDILGDNSSTNTITAVKGLAFGTLEENPWHITSDRWSDTGHGVTQAYDASRFVVDGGRSLYFGIEDPNNTWANNSLYRDRTVQNYLVPRAPGGAHGTVISDPFSLKGYTAADLPTLYYNYYLQTDGTNSNLNDSRLMRDSFRAYVAGDDGIWHLLSTNNSQVGGGNADDEFDYSYGNQEVFDVATNDRYGGGPAPDSWRQARINLAPFAGEENLRLRFDFSTAGSMNVGHDMTTGDELFVVPGADILDAEPFTIRGADPASATVPPAVKDFIFEFDTDITLNAPTGVTLVDGWQLQVRDESRTRIFEFDSNGAYNGANPLGVPNYRLAFTATQTAAQVAENIRVAIANQFGNQVKVTRYDNHVNIVNDNRVNFEGQLTVTLDPAMLAAIGTRFVSGTDGVTAGHIAVNVDASMTEIQVRDQIVPAMAANLNKAGQTANTSLIKYDENLIRVIGRRVTSPGPLGLSQRETADGLENGLQGDQFGVFYDSNSTFTTTPLGLPPSDPYSRAVQGQGNGVQGVYIDDIVIGFAERGEMVTSAQTNATTFSDNRQGSTGTTVGSYQLEIRPGASYLDTSLDPPPPWNDRAWDTNDRLAEQVAFVAPPGYDIKDGQQFALSDGVDTLTFEYDDLDLRRRVNVASSSLAIPLDTTGGFPSLPYPMPSPTGAAGPSSLVALANTTIALFDKTGTRTSALVDLRTFFPNEQAGYNPGPLQPSAIYDRYSGRFVVIASDNDALTAPNSLGSRYLLIAISKTNNPTTLDGNSWYYYSIPTTWNFNGNGDSGIYYPKIAADEDSLYITGNYFRYNDNSSQGTLVTRLDKMSMLGGVLGARVDREAATGQGLIPVQSVGRAAADPQLFVQAVPTVGIRVWEMGDGNILQIVQTLSSPFTTQTSDVPQAGTAATLQSFSPAVINAVWRNDSIWTTHTVSSATANGEATVKWYEITTTAGAYGVRQQGTIDPGPGVHTFMPAISVDAAGNMGITYTESSASIFPRMMVAGRESAAVLGTTEPGVIAASSTGPYDLVFSFFGNPIFAAGDSETWGDSAAVVVDPFDDMTFWALGETAATNGTYNSQWDTRWAKFTIGSAGAGVPGEGVVPGNVQVPFRVSMTNDEIAEAIRDAINSADVQAVLEILASLSDGTAAGTGSTSNAVNLYGNAVSNRLGGTNFGEIDWLHPGSDTSLTSPVDPGTGNPLPNQQVVVYGLNTVDGNSQSHPDLGDQNAPRAGANADLGEPGDELGPVRHHRGCRSGAARPGTARMWSRERVTNSHPGSVRNLREPNAQRLLPGVTVANNLVASNGWGGILVSGDNAAGVQLAPCRSPES